ncbi:cytochrome c5 family protein [Lysobacter pythonis]|uniref:Cytochrome c5 family protein n=1 Tax=Solilutibacter pythonis TaxID=2483112 RepID=A0A3M2I696_9GAMM|nr:c-type cytochrome [Lysobacter pythonis]RMH93794.1 cytochrome c5 family protein [Lysobacter pythonis]
MNKHDSVFLKKFSTVIAFLVVVTIGLIFLARHINKLLPAEMTPQAQAQTDARITPVGAVYVGAEGMARALAADAARAAAVTSQAAYGGTLDGKVIYDSLCTGCHTSGAGGAPKLDAAGIGARLAQQGLDELVKKAIGGFTGSTGVMPAKGGNPALTDEQVQKTVEWMVEQSK